MPLISVVVPCRNERNNIVACVQSILEQKEPQGGYEVIVADGMSDDGTREILAQLERIDSRLRVIDNPERATGCGMNAGIRNARGDYIAIMGAHSRYASDYLIRCLDLIVSKGADNVGGAVFAEGHSYVEKAISAAHHSGFSSGGSRWHAVKHDGRVDSVWGGFYRRDVFERIGLFDESLVRNQDDEFNLRLTKAGGRIWQSPLIRSWYRPRSSLRSLFQQYRQYGYWKVRVIKKHGQPASLRHLVPTAFVLSLIAAVVLGAVSWGIGTIARLHTLTVIGQFSGILFAAVLGAYLVVIVLASVSAAARSDWRLIVLLPLAFACHHLGYGIGFLEGLAEVGTGRSARVGRMSQLTR